MLTTTVCLKSEEALRVHVQHGTRSHRYFSPVILIPLVYYTVIFLWYIRSYKFWLLLTWFHFWESSALRTDYRKQDQCEKKKTEMFVLQMKAKCPSWWGWQDQGALQWDWLLFLLSLHEVGTPWRGWKVKKIGNVPLIWIWRNRVILLQEKRFRFGWL